MKVSLRNPLTSILLVTIFSVTLAPIANGAQNSALLRKLKSLEAARPSGEVSITVIDLSHPKSTAWAEVNGDKIYYSASLNKLQILLGAYYNEAHPSGIFERDHAPDVFSKELTEMISVSDNLAAGKMYSVASYDSIYRASLAHGIYSLSGKDQGKGLWIGGPYSRAATFTWASEMEKERGWYWLDRTVKTHPPLNMMAMGTTSHLARFLWELNQGRLVNRNASRRMFETLKTVRTSKWFNPNGITGDDPKAQIAGKTGTWDVWQGEASIVWGNGYRYILTMMTKNISGKSYYETVGREINRMIRTRAASKDSSKVHLGNIAVND